DPQAAGAQRTTHEAAGATGSHESAFAAAGAHHHPDQLHSRRLRRLHLHCCPCLLHPHRRHRRPYFV
ncbi:unnamed protein product, partial [Closterium sp. NIES-53]